jgi:hypothetical protein
MPSEEHHTKALGKRSKALLDDFIEGGKITVRWDPRRRRNPCILARLERSSDSTDYEMWELRAMDPRPGARVLGGFAEKDVFVGVTWDYRENFEALWPAEIGYCVGQWKRLFGACRPFEGIDPSEYLSQPFEVV